MEIDFFCFGTTAVIAVGVDADNQENQLIISFFLEWCAEIRKNGTCSDMGNWQGRRFRQ
jgi:hypothetical protein